MDDVSITRVERSKADELQKILRDFIAKHSQTFFFPQLASDNRRRRLWQAVVLRLNDTTVSGCHTLCLEVVRILSRDKDGLNEILTADMLDTIVRLAGLCVVNGDELISIANKQNDFRVIIEAQKCLCNLIFNSTTAQEICCQNGCLEGIMVRLKTYKEPDLLHEIKFFDMRMLFLLTALRADIRPKLHNELHGVTYLVEMLDLILKNSAEKRVHPSPIRQASLPQKEDLFTGLLLDDADVDLACEVMKILFNLTIHVPADRDNLDEEEEAHFMRLVSVLHDILISKTQTKEKREELQSHTVNLLVNMPAASYEELLTPQMESHASMDRSKDCEYDGQNMEAIVALLDFLDERLDKPSRSLKESLSPILTCLCECSRCSRFIRKFLRIRVLPPLRDVYQRPELGNTLRNKLCRLLTSQVMDIKNLVAEFLFVLCKENVARLIKYTGYGNAAGLLASRGLMTGGRGGKGNYSSDSEDSETEEYREARDRINPVLGCYEEPREDPMAGMSEEQKEYEAIQLVNVIDKLSRVGMIKPMRIDDEGVPKPVEHILQLQDRSNGANPPDESVQD